MVVKSELAIERTIQLSALKARYLEAGEGEPTIFLHPVGFTGAAEVWLPCLKAGLAQKLRVIAPDMLGWGPGERPLIKYSFAYWMDHVRELQDALGLKKTNIVGHSLGGWIAACLAYESPNRVNKLVLVANAGLNQDPPAGLADFKVLPEYRKLEQEASDLTRKIGDLSDENTQTASQTTHHPPSHRSNA